MMSNCLLRKASIRISKNGIHFSTCAVQSYPAWLDVSIPLSTSCLWQVFNTTSPFSFNICYVVIIILIIDTNIDSTPLKAILGMTMQTIKMSTYGKGSVPLLHSPLIFDNYTLIVYTYIDSTLGNQSQRWPCGQ